MKKFLLLFLVVTATTLLSGCSTVKIEVRGNKPVIFNTPTKEYTVLNHFILGKVSAFDYSGTPDISAVIYRALHSYPEADAVINLFITIKKGPLETLGNLLTLYFADIYTMKIEGDIIKYK